MSSMQGLEIKLSVVHALDMQFQIQIWNPPGPHIRFWNLVLEYCNFEKLITNLINVHFRPNWHVLVEQGNWSLIRTIRQRVCQLGCQWMRTLWDGKRITFKIFFGYAFLFQLISCVLFKFVLPEFKRTLEYSDIVPDADFTVFGTFIYKRRCFTWAQTKSWNISCRAQGLSYKLPLNSNK